MSWGVSSLQMPFPETIQSDMEMSTLTSSPDTQLDIPARGPAFQRAKSVPGTAFSHFVQVYIRHFIK